MSTDLEKISISDEENGGSESYHIEKGTETVMMKEDVIPVYDPKEDPKNPLVPASHDIMLYFNTDLTTINATFAIFLLMNGVAPLFWAPLSERVGRKWIYIIAMILYTVCTIICGISKNIGMFFAFRIIQGCFACVGQAVGSGTISDLCQASERGKMMSYYIFSLILGPPVAAIVGGYIDQYLGWQWIFYIMAIMGSILTIVSILFLSESLYRPERDNLPKPSTLGDRLRRMKFNPFSSLILLKEPDVFLVCLSIGVSFGCFYFFVAILPSTFSPIYGFSPSQVGLCFIAGGLGNALGSIVVGHIDYRYCTYQKKKNGGVDCKEFKLKLMYAVIPFIFLGTLLYGWFLHFKLHWMGALAVFSCSAFGIMFTVTIVTNYLVESNLKVAASAVAASNFSRSLFAMIFSISAVKIREAMGDAWTYTFMAILMTVLYLVCTPIVIKYGEGWRQKRS
ncbi:major facilitator superfamily domain-containing protein [Helicostylum pulchrum]|nr:major facilitator superfamily domain-containing protein [Helicostylum pulchrum]